MATLIGLSIRTRMLRSLPERFKVDIRVRKGTHQSENAGRLRSKRLTTAAQLVHYTISEPAIKR